MPDRKASGRLSAGALVFLALVGAFLSAFLIYPILYVFKEAFWIEGRVSLIYFRFIAGGNPVFRESVWNSFCLGVATTALATAVAVPAAFVGARLRFRGKGLLTGLLLAPMIMPPFVGAIGMRRLLARGGSLNLLLQKVGLAEEGIDFLGAGGFWAVVALQVLHLYPIMYLNVVAALANVDPSLEDAARNMGDSGFRLFRKVTFPLMLPGFFAGAVLVFIWAFTDLGTPLILNYKRVVAYQIFDKVSDLHTNPIAYALVVVVILLTAAVFLAGRFYMGRRGYEMLAKGTTAREERAVGGWATLGIWVGLIVLVGAAVLPHVSVFLTSIAGEWSDTVLPTRVTGEFYGKALRHDLATIGVRNSLLLSFGSTALDVILGVGIAYLIVRKRFAGAGMLDALAMAPLALPGIVIAFGYMASFSGTVLDPGRNPFVLLMIAYAVRRLPYMVRAASAGFQQTSVSLEEAAMNVGASPLRAFFKVTAPLVAASLIAGAILSFSFAMLEVSDSLILAVNRQHYPLTKAIYKLLDISGDGMPCAMGMVAMVLLVGMLVAAGALLGRRMGQLFRV